MGPGLGTVGCSVPLSSAHSEAPQQRQESEGIKEAMTWKPMVVTGLREGVTGETTKDRSQGGDCILEEAPLFTDTSPGSMGLCPGLPTCLNNLHPPGTWAPLVSAPHLSHEGWRRRKDCLPGSIFLFQGVQTVVFTAQCICLRLTLTVVLDWPSLLSPQVSVVVVVYFFP